MATIEKKAPSGRFFHSAEGHNIKMPHREMCLVRLLLFNIERQIGGHFYAVSDVDGEGLAVGLEKEDVALTEGEEATCFCNKAGGAFLLLGGEGVNRLPLTDAHCVIETVALSDGEGWRVHIGHERGSVVVAVCPALADVLAEAGDAQRYLILTQARFCIRRNEKRSLVDMDGRVGHRV